MTAPVPFHASKWLKIQMFIDAFELENLFSEMGSFTIHPIGRVVEEGGEEISHVDFIKTYESYVLTLQIGNLPKVELEAVAITTDKHDLHFASVGDNKRLVRIIRPVIQLQAHRFAYSPLDGKFRSNVLGQDSVLWGLQFSYPQIYQDPTTKEIITVTDQTTFPNAVVYKKIQLWTRHHTIPTPFLVDEKKTNVPFRLGKRCLPWINAHPQLKELNIKVVTNTHVES